MSVKLSNKKKGILGIVGHAGCGHANSHMGFIQDDSGGLTAVLTLLQEATGIDLAIKSVEVKTGLNNACFSVKTVSGGEASAFARRGITKFEARLAQYVIGKQAINTQALAQETFGRILGQGAMEVPVAFQTAIAHAAIDSFAKQFPNNFLFGEEGIQGNCGKVFGTVLDINGVAVSVLGLTNATIGGLGPNEDIEGNVNLFGKTEIMAKLGLDALPTFVVEGKVCSSPVSDEITEPTFLIRAFPNDDNPIVAHALLNAALSIDQPAIYRPEILKRSPTAMRDLTKRMGDYIVELGKRIGQSTTAEEKVILAAQLNRFASEELGGITFMGNAVHAVMGGVGMIPGSSCVMSLFIPRSQLEEEVQPALTLEDGKRFVEILKQGVAELAKNLPQATNYYQEVAKRYEAQSAQLQKLES